MREIKFRAWVNSERIMFYDVKNISFNDSEIIFSEPDDGARFRVHPDYFLQYTGLKDKNGKEIYEGDIIRHRNNRMATVEYWDDSVSFQMGLSMSVLDQELGDYSEIEVIGNIYETPELLEHQSKE